MSLYDWQAEAARKTFGWVRDDGSNRIEEVSLFISVQNGKTTFDILLILLGVLTGGKNFRSYGAFPSLKQGENLFGKLADQIQHSPLCQRMVRKGQLEVFKGRTSQAVSFHPAGSSYTTLPASKGTTPGWSSNLTIIDEIWSMNNHKDVFTNLKSRGAAQRNTLFVTSSTVGHYDPTSLVWEHWDYSTKCQKGIIENTSFLPIIYSCQALAGNDKALAKPEVWAKANPVLDDPKCALNQRRFAEAYHVAKQAPALWNGFQKDRLNIWTNAGADYITPEELQAVTIEQKDWPTDLKQHVSAFDLSATSDFTAGAVLSTRRNDPTWYLRAWCYLPEKKLEERQAKNRQTTFDAWAREGLITKCGGKTIDLERVQDDILQMNKQTRFSLVGFDQKYAVGTAELLKNKHGLPVHYIGQDYRYMDQPIKTLRDRVVNHQVKILANPVLAWMFSNCKLSTNADKAYRIIKNKCGDSVDMVICCVMCVFLQLQLDQYVAPSVSFV